MRKQFIESVSTGLPGRELVHFQITDNKPPPPRGIFDKKKKSLSLAAIVAMPTRQDILVRLDNKGVVTQFNDLVNG